LSNNEDELKKVTGGNSLLMDKIRQRGAAVRDTLKESKKNQNKLDAKLGKNTPDGNKSHTESSQTMRVRYDECI
jgi:hypothetical protein